MTLVVLFFCMSSDLLFVLFLHCSPHLIRHCPLAVLHRQPSSHSSLADLPLPHVASACFATSFTAPVDRSDSPFAATAAILHFLRIQIDLSAQSLSYLCLVLNQAVAAETRSSRIQRIRLPLLS